jgi:hypothetical protein
MVTSFNFQRGFNHEGNNQLLYQIANDLEQLTLLWKKKEEDLWTPVIEHPRPCLTAVALDVKLLFCKLNSQTQFHDFTNQLSNKFNQFHWNHEPRSLYRHFV